MVAKQTKQTVGANTPGTIVLQWLSYAFWGWAVVAIAYLAAVITSYLLDGTWVSDSTEPVAYGMAATLVLVPFALVCDWLYSKREQQDKHGIASVVMIIHAVLFTLFAIGALISVAFSVVGLLLTTGDTSGPVIAIVVSAVLAILYIDLVVRIVRPLLIMRLRLVFRISMALVTLTALVWGALGPFAQTVATKDDRAVRDGLQSLNYAINQYASTNNALPTTLTQVIQDETSLQGVYPTASADNLTRLVEKGSITYKANVKPAEDDTTTDSLAKTTTKTFYYELCGVFTHGLKQRSWDGIVYPSSPETSEEYSSYIQTGTIDAGTKCYKLSTTSYKTIGL
jgi:hypothetical protein